MLKKTVPTLITAALAWPSGTMQLAHAQKNYTDGGDIHSGSHTKKASPHANAAKSEQVRSVHRRREEVHPDRSRPEEGGSVHGRRQGRQS